MILGRNPGAIPRGKTIDEFVLPAVSCRPASDLLTNRPDIRQAERGSDRRQRKNRRGKISFIFPSISLTGMLALQAKTLNLFSGPAKVWSFAVPLTAPIFTGGSIPQLVRSVRGGPATGPPALSAVHPGLHSAKSKMPSLTRRSQGNGLKFKHGCLSLSVIWCRLARFPI